MMGWILLNRLDVVRKGMSNMLPIPAPQVTGACVKLPVTRLMSGSSQIAINGET